MKPATLTSPLEESLDRAADDHWPESWTSPGGMPVLFRAHRLASAQATNNPLDVRLWLEHARLNLLRGFDELLCLEGLSGVEHLPHQIETVRRVLRQFRGKVLLADEVGLGKTIEACLLLREYLLRSLAKRVLILVPAPLVSQWRDELQGKFGLEFAIPPRSSVSDEPEFWMENDRILASLSFAKTKKRSPLISAAPWDLVVVDEAHHCKNRTSLNWRFVDSLQRKYTFLLTATPVQNNLLELYNLLTLLSPGHLRTEADFKKQYVTRGNPRDPRNRHRLRSLLSELMIRNTRSLVNINLPPRYAQTVIAQPSSQEQAFLDQLYAYLRELGDRLSAGKKGDEESDDSALEPDDGPIVSRMKFASLLAAEGSHPHTLAASLEKLAAESPGAAKIAEQAWSIRRSAKDQRLVELLRQSKGHKILVFVGFLRTLSHLKGLLEEEGLAFSVFSGEQSAEEKDAAVAALREEVDIMLCTDSGGEGRNLQFADTLVNYDLPWNPMRIEQRVGRVHRFGQKRDVFIFNLCTAGSIEERILSVLNEKLRMFELVVGEVGSILGNLDENEQFETMVVDLWIKSKSRTELAASFESLGETLVSAQSEYIEAKELDEAIFGDDFQ